VGRAGAEDRALFAVAAIFYGSGDCSGALDSRDAIENQIDFRETETSKIDLEIEVYEALQFKRKKLAILASVLCQFVVGKDVGATLRIAQMR
jgi:hypothetical protein